MRRFAGRCGSAPLFQKFRLLKEINELEIIGEDQGHVKLTPDQRDALVLALRTGLNKQGRMPFSKLKRVLKIGNEVRFNKETDNRSDLEGDVIYFRMSQPECFGNRWAALSVETQAAITEKLRTEADYGTLLEWLKSEAGLPGWFHRRRHRYRLATEHRPTRPR